MFCEKCGQQIPDNQMFCTYCGSPVRLNPTGDTNPQGQQFQQGGQQFQQMGMQPVKPPKKEKTPEQKARTKRNIIIASILATLIIGLGVAILLVLMFKTPTIDLNDYITIECDGYNSIGKAQAIFDEDKFYDDYENKLKFKSDKAEQNSEYTSAAELLLEKYIKGSLDKDANLSNGDKIKYKWNIDEEGVKAEIKVELEYEDIDFTVKDLKDAETFDAFASIEVIFEGSAPNGTVYINNNNDMDPVEYWSLTADKTEGLNNGDKIVVTFDVDDSDIEECVDETGKIPNALSKEYEVSGLSSYVTSSAQISNEALESMKTRVKSNAENDIPYEAENPRYDYAGYYLLSEKPDAGANDRNRVVMVYAVSTDLDIAVDSTNYVGNYGYYAVTTFYDVELDGSGSSVVDVNNSDDTTEELELNTNVSDKWGSDYTITFWGYESIADVKKNCVDNATAEYNVEEVIDTSVKPVASSGSAASSNPEDGMVIPDSNTRYLTEAEVKAMTQDEIQDAINEIYARHGYIFQTESIQKYYSQFSWYTPYSGEQEKVKKLFNSVETANVMLLDKYRD